MAELPLPILYSFRRCPYAMRARLALAISGTTCELREVKLAAKPEAMLKASPKGTVPVLVEQDGEVVDESIEIMRLALSRNDPEGWLDRDDADLIATNDGEFKHHLDRYKYPDRHGSDSLEHREAALAFLSELDRRIGNSGQISGTERGLSDMAIMPFVRQFAAVDREWFGATGLNSLIAWLEDHLVSDLFTGVMKKRVPWAEGDVPVYFPG